MDANLLIYAWDTDAIHHKSALAWLNGKLLGSARVGLPWEACLAYMRVVTNPRIFATPQSVPQAWLQVEKWLSNENVWIPTPGEGHAGILGKLLRNLGGGAKLIPDAHLAALAMEHGLTLCSTDGDFARFAGLRWVNPLLTNRENPRLTDRAKPSNL